MLTAPTSMAARIERAECEPVVAFAARLRARDREVMIRDIDAARQDCDLAVVTTEPASKSQENVQRAGFVLLYSRAVLVRPVREKRG